MVMLVAASWVPFVDEELYSVGGQSWWSPWYYSYLGSNKPNFFCRNVM